MRLPRALAALILLASSSATACADLLDPGTDALRVRLTVAPESIGPGASTEVEVVFRNLLDDKLQITFGASCPFYLEAYRKDGINRKKVELEGTTYLCTAHTTDTSIPAGDSMVVRQTIRAQVGEEPAPSGDYVVRAVFTTNIQPLETSLRVR